MAQRVVEQDPHQLPDGVLVARYARVDGRALQRPVDVNGASLAANLGDQGAHLEWGELQTQARVGSGQREQPIDEARHTSCLGADVFRGCSTRLIGDGWSPGKQSRVALN